MKILHIIVGLGKGGAEGSLVKICLADSENHHAVVSLTTQGFFGPVLRNNGVSVTALHLRPVSLGKAVRALRTLIKEHSPDVLHSWMPHGILLGWLATLFLSNKRPAQIWGIRATDYGSGARSASSLSLVRVLAVLSWTNRYKILAVGQAAKLSHVKMGFNSKCISVIENGYSDMVSPAVKYSSHVQFTLTNLLVDHSFVIGCVARFHPQKNHFGLLDALALLADKGFEFFVILAGKGVSYENEALRDYVESRKLGPHVYLAGEVKTPEELYPAMDLHVLASSFGEGFPNAVAESMLLGVPNVVTDVGDSARLVDGVGWVVPPDNPTMLAGAIADAIVSGSETMSEIGLKSRAKILKDLPESLMVDRFLRSYEEILVQSKEEPMIPSCR